MSQIDPKSLWGFHSGMKKCHTKFQNFVWSKTVKFSLSYFLVALHERHCSSFKNMKLLTCVDFHVKIIFMKVTRISPSVGRRLNDIALLQPMFEVLVYAEPLLVQWERTQT